MSDLIELDGVRGYPCEGREDPNCCAWCGTHWDGSEQLCAVRNAKEADTLRRVLQSVCETFADVILRVSDENDALRRAANMSACDVCGEPATELGFESGRARCAKHPLEEPAPCSDDFNSDDGAEREPADGTWGRTGAEVKGNCLPELLTVNGVASYFDVHPRSVRRWIAAGRIPVIRLGRTIRVAKDDLRAYIDARRPPERRKL